MLVPHTLAGPTILPRRGGGGGGGTNDLCIRLLSGHGTNF